MLSYLGTVFCLLLGVSSDYAQPITGQVTEVTCPVIGRAQPELTPSKRQKTSPYFAYYADKTLSLYRCGHGGCSSLVTWFRCQLRTKQVTIQPHLHATPPPPPPHTHTHTHTPPCHPPPPHTHTHTHTPTPPPPHLHGQIHIETCPLGWTLRHLYVQWWPIWFP